MYESRFVLLPNIIYLAKYISGNKMVFTISVKSKIFLRRNFFNIGIALNNLMHSLKLNVIYFGFGVEEK